MQARRGTVGPWCGGSVLRCRERPLEVVQPRAGGRMEEAAARASFRGCVESPLEAEKTGGSWLLLLGRRGKGWGAREMLGEGSAVGA